MNIDIIHPSCRKPFAAMLASAVAVAAYVAMTPAFAAGSAGNKAKLVQEDDPKAGLRLLWADEFDYEDSRLEEKWVAENASPGHILCSRWREFFGGSPLFRA